MFKQIFYTLLLLLIATQPEAQEFFFKNITVDNGLSHNLVFCTLQDEYGFMWFGTKDGLNRYDGNSIKIFRHLPGDSGSLGNNDVRSLFCRTRNEIWVGTRKGLFIYNPLTEQFKEVTLFRNSFISVISADSYNNIWLISDHSLYKITAKDTVTMAPLKGIATSICMLRNGQLWIGTTSGQLARYHYDSNTISFAALFGKSFNRSRWIEKLYEGSGNSLLAGTASAGLIAYDYVTGTQQHILNFDDNDRPLYIRDILKDGNDFWIASESGIYIYDSSYTLKKHLVKDPNIKNSLPDNAIYTLLKDKAGNIWAGSYFKGVSMHPKQEVHFSSMPAQMQVPTAASVTFRNAVIREMDMDQYQNLWIGTEDNGVYQLNPAQNKITHFKSGADPTTLCYNNIHGLLCSNDTLWVGTFERGLDLLNIKTGKVFQHYDMKSGANLGNNFIITFCKTKSGQIYLGTGTGMERFEPATKKFKRIEAVPYDFIYSIIEDHTGMLWIGTEDNGIRFYRPSDESTGTLNDRITSGAKLPPVKINSLLEDHSRKIWIATEGSGLYIFDPGRKSLYQFSTQTGLPSNFVYKMLQDQNGNIWASTSLGLVMIDAAKNIQVYTQQNGLVSNQFNYNSGFTKDSRELYFGTTSGLVSFDPAHMVLPSVNIPLYFTGLKISGREVPMSAPGSPLKTALINTSELSVPYTQSTFSIDFAALIYDAPDEIVYTYKLTGMDDKWTELGKSRSIYFTQLPAGTYELLLKAASPYNKRYKGAVIKLQIRVLPPFWKSTTAEALYLLFSILILFLAIRYYHKHQKKLQAAKIKENNRLMELENNKAKIEFFTNIAHEIKTPLTLIQGPVEDLLLRSGADAEYELRLIGKNTERLLQLTHQLLDFKRIENNKVAVTLSEINLSELMKEVYENFRSAAALRKIDYFLQLPEAAVMIFSDEEALIKIFYNLFSNGIKYSSTSFNVRLKTLVPEQKIVISFENDGTTIPGDAMDKIFRPFYRLEKNKLKEGTGIGLSIAHSLTQLVNGTLHVSVENGKNIFILTLPEKFNRGTNSL